VCRTQRPLEGTTELYLDWSGDVARGSLRRTSASGNVSELRVEGERHGATVVLDDPTSDDLVVHAATLRTEDGKQRIQLGDWHQPWSACE
jgi:hypothetical protein